MSQRTKTIIISIVICIVLAGVGVGLYCAWPAIVGTITGNAYYTYEDVQNAYDDGYTDGIRNESELTAQIDYYKAEVDKYIESLAEAQIKIENLEKDLQDAINSGNADKETIAGLQEDLAEAQADLTAKQEQIEELQDDIKYYQELLEAYADSDKLHVTFTMVDNGKERNYDVQVVEPNGYLSEVITPDRADFEGWSLTKGGELIDDLTTIQVTENMTIYGMCTNTVTFMVNGEEYATQEVSYGKYATYISTEPVTNYNLNGWSLSENGEVIIFRETPIFKDTTFFAIFVESLSSFEEKTWNGLTNFYANCIWTDGTNIYYSYGSEQYVLNQETSTWEVTEWGKRLENGASMFYPQGDYIWINKTTNTIYYSHDDEQYVLNKNTMEWETMVWYGLTNFNADDIWTDGQNVYCSSNFNSSEQYVLNQETSTWEEKTWNGLTNLLADCIWTDGINIYYSNGEIHYVLDITTSTWTSIAFNVSFNGMQVWTDGKNTYLTLTNRLNGEVSHYILEKSSSTWLSKSWNNLPSSLQTTYDDQAIYFWTDGTNIYYSNGYVLV